MGLSSALSFICIPLSVPFNKLSLCCHGTWDQHNKQIMNDILCLFLHRKIWKTFNNDHANVWF